jgi:hypothetical protein
VRLRCRTPLLSSKRGLVFNKVQSPNRLSQRYRARAPQLAHLLYLVRGDTCASFAKAAHFSFVRNAWRAVVAPHYLFFIGLLVVFKATMGLLVLSGGAGRRSA